MLYVFRRLLRVPGFSILVIITTALAIGVNAGLFSVTKAVLFAALGVPEPDRLVYYTVGSGANSLPLSGPAYEALHRSNPMFSQLAIWDSSLALVLRTPDGATNLSGALVNGDFFSVMKLTPALGRFFDDHEDQSGGGENGWPAVLGYSFWAAHFAKDPNIIGKSIVIDGAPAYIIGVLPMDFSGLNPPIVAQVLLPRHFLSVSSPGQDRFANPGYMEWDVYGRLPQGATLASVKAILPAVDSQVRKEADPTGELFTDENFPGTGSGSLIFAASGELGHSYRLNAVRTPLLAMMGLAAVLFLFGACNLVLLFASRSTRSAQDAAIRLAFGATFKHILGIASLEGIVLAIAGSIAAIPLAWGVTHTLSLLVRSTTGFESFPTVTPSILLLLAGTGAVFLIVTISVVQASRWHARQQTRMTLSMANRSITGRSNPWIIGSEVFAAAFLLTLTAVGGAAFETLSHQPSGFDTNTAVVTSLDLLDRQDHSGTIAGEKLNRIMQLIANSPGVRSVAITNLLPLSGASARASFAVRLGSGMVHREEGMWPATVSREYFSASGNRILRGRDFVANDSASDPVCIVSMSAARALFGSENPLERYVYANESEASAGSKPYCRVVGIAGDAHLKSMSEPPDNAVYLLSSKVMSNIIVRAATSNLAAEAIRNSVQAVAPMSLTSGIDSIQTHVEDDLRFIRALTLFDALCTGITVLSMAVGLFGVLSIEVAAHRRDIGIQLALGSGVLSVCANVLRRFVKPIAVGFGIGSALTLIAVLQLRDVYSINLITGIGAFLAGCAFTLIVMVIAVSAPLRRALGISPADCLRSE